MHCESQWIQQEVSWNHTTSVESIDHSNLLQEYTRTEIRNPAADVNSEFHSLYTVFNVDDRQYEINVTTNILTLIEIRNLTLPTKETTPMPHISNCVQI